jgi:glycosyltransferase involved in cell wall biosynthesis
MINVRYSCAALGASGYSEASRNYIAALNTQRDVNLSVVSANFERWETDQSGYMKILAPLINKPMPNPDVNIIHMTPENYPKYMQKGAKNIGYTVWETSKLPPKWVPLCNMMDEIWVPCDWNVQVFKDSGVTVPVKKVEHTIERSELVTNEEWDTNLPIQDKFLFYSIFQWTERKNPDGLIKAFVSEFSRDENVCLVLKTYRQNSASPVDRKWVADATSNIVSLLHIKDPPPVLIAHGALPREQMLALHKRGDCFVLPHKSEGWGVPHFEAMGTGTPVIATNFGGNTEFMNKENSYLLDYNLEPVSNMPWQIYSGRTDWANPNMDQCRKMMREIFSNRESAQVKGALGKESLEKYSWENIGAKMFGLLQDITGRK